MVRFVRVGYCSDARIPEAFAWARKAVQYANAHFPDLKMQFLWQRFAAPGMTCFLMFDCEDLAVLDRHLRAQADDAGWAEMNSGAAGVFLEDDGEIMVLESV